jgi:hypothetical protein
MHIENLYKNKSILLFRECYALEKVHGSSAHVAWRTTENTEAINLFAGGGSHENFRKLFDVEAMTAVFRKLGHPTVTVYGESYGGSMQKMSDVYGKECRFIAFDVQVGDTWLNVPNAEEVVLALGLEFVPYERVSTDVELLNALRDRPSRLAARLGLGDDKVSEGVVLRPLQEFQGNNGKRVIAKHKGEAFNERTNTPHVDEAKVKVLSEAQAVAEEWVTEMRLTHVLDKMPPEKKTELKNIPDVGTAMVEDVYREAEGEIVESREVERAIRIATGKLFKSRITRVGGS